MRTQTTNIYDTITQQIITAIEQGTDSFQLPWHKSGSPIERPTNVSSGKTYRGINNVALWASSFTQEFSHGLWGTYRQWQDKGAQVKKGEKSSPIVFYKDLKSEDRSDQEDQKRRFVVKASRVFNVSQVEGYEPETLDTELDYIKPIESAERFISNTNAEIQIKGDRAFYRSSEDRITMPEKHRFTDTESSSATENWYAILLHELTHWTGEKSRLDRQLGNRFGDKAYAMEELIAELGSAFLSSDLRLNSEPRPDHAMYIASWLRVLKSDNKAIFNAASLASSAAEYLASLQPSQEVA